MLGFIGRSLLLLLLFIATAGAVDESRLWLPQKYQQIKPQLLAAAWEAESTRRCQRVVAGKVLPAKTTAEHYYFVITCQDEARRTYNLSYHFPVAGESPVLIAEQYGGGTPESPVNMPDETITASQAVALCERGLAFVNPGMDNILLASDESIKLSDQLLVTEENPALIAEQYDDAAPESPVSMPDEVSTTEQAMALCKNDLVFVIQNMDDIVLAPDESLVVTEIPAGYQVVMSFTTQSNLGTVIAYEAVCRASHKGATGYNLLLQTSGALAVCRDHLRFEAILLGKSFMLEDQFQQLVAEQGAFAFQLPFVVSTGTGREVRYRADCHVDAAGDSKLVMVLQPEGALAYCLDELQAEILLMKQGVVDEKPQQSRVLNERFEDELGFDADDPEGNVRKFRAELATEQGAFAFQLPIAVSTGTGREVQYRADCHVDAAGDSKVVMVLQAEGALTYCLDELQMETLLMKQVVVDEKPLRSQMLDEGFEYEVGFDAGDPEGNSRRFLAQCSVDKTGRTEVKIAPDKSTIIGVCINGVKKQARTMRAVRVLEEQISPPQEDTDGLFSIIPFDAEDPNGRQLHFLGECRVSDRGKTSVTIKPRYIP